MLFNSLTYLIFLAIVVSLYWILPRRPRLLLIMFSSILFYGFWRLSFIPLFMTSITIDFLVALKIERSEGEARRRWMQFAVGINLAVLLFFKYLIFFESNFIGFASLLGYEIDPFFTFIILPLGISFYTFHSISYLVDVYRRVIKPEHDFVLYVCYVMFFPQMVAGPILRAREVMTQLSNRPEFHLSDIADGVKRIVAGLLLKVALADTIAPMVDTGFAQPVDTLSALDVWTLAFLFGFQIYFDFSAYSHIAIGSARLMGIILPENFNFPYIASSPKEFWKRWHISLSSWIRDYLYLPLAGVKVGQESSSQGGIVSLPDDGRRTYALFASWALMGLWHGANWTFALWGLYHATMIYAHRLIERNKLGFSGALATVVAMLVTVPIMMLGWIPFRAESLTQALVMWGKVIDPREYFALSMRENVYLVTALLLALTTAAYFLDRFRKETSVPEGARFVGDTAFYTASFAMLIIFLRPISQFIYFQF